MWAVLRKKVLILFASMQIRWKEQVLFGHLFDNERFSIVSQALKEMHISFTSSVFKIPGLKCFGIVYSDILDHQRFLAQLLGSNIICLFPLNAPSNFSLNSSFLDHFIGSFNFLLPVVYAHFVLYWLRREHRLYFRSLVLASDFLAPAKRMVRAVLPSDPVVAHLHGEHQEFFLVLIHHEPVGRVYLLNELVRFLEDERLRARYLDLRNLNCCVVTLEYLTDDLARLLVITTAHAASFGCRRPQQHVLSFPSEIVSCACHATIVPIVCALEHWRALL